MTDRNERSRGGRDNDRGSRRGSSYQYQRRDAASTQKRSEQGGTDFDVYIKDIVKLFKPNDGDNAIRILPPTFEGAEHYGLDIYVHYGIGPDNQAYLCLDKMQGKPCPICEEMHRAQKQGDEDYAKKLKPAKRVLFYLVDRDHEKEGVMAWASPWTIDRDICALSVDKRTGEVLELDNPDDGYDILFERKGKGERTEYIGLQVARKTSPLGDDAWLQFAVDNPLDTILNFYEYDHIAKVFGGASTKEESSDSGRNRRTESHGQSNDDHTWDAIHSMTYQELCDLIDSKRLNINPDKSGNDEELADWICEDLNIKKASKDEDASSGRRRLSEASSRRRVD